MKKLFGNMTKKKIILMAVAAVLLIAIVWGAIYLFGTYLPEKREHEELMRQVEKYYADKIETYKAQNEKYGDFEVDVAFLGDSLTDGYDLGRYYPQYLTVNRGIGGETTHGLEKRLDVSLFDLKPKVAVILIGANNMDSMFENYENMLIEIKKKAPDTKIILCSLTSMGGESWGKKNHLAAYNNVGIKLMAKKYGFEFVDLYSALFDLATGEIVAEYTTDGGHLTHEGYVVFTEAVTPVIDALLADWGK